MSKSAPPLDLRPDDWDIVCSVLRQHVPDREVLAFGSRATWTAKNYSDLDLAILGDEPLPLDVSSALAEAFNESDLPFKVDLVDWARIDKTFRKIIRRDGLNVQTPAAGSDVIDAVRRSSGSEGEWCEHKLGTLATVKGGKRLPNGNSLVEYPTSHPYIRTRDINGHKISVSDLLYVPEYVFPSIKSYIVNKRDVIISIVGTIGLCAIVPDVLDKASLTENCAKLVKLDEEKLDRNFLYYFLVSPSGQQEIEQRIVGSTQRKLPLYNIKEIPLLVPPLPKQQAIASVFSSLDDKIELNRRMNETLEAMARAIFKDWFVDFGPTRAKAEGQVPYLAPELWDLFPDALDEESKPVGWATIPLKQLGRVITGKTPSTKMPEFFGDDMPFLKIPDMHDRIYALRTSTSLSEEGARSQENKTLPAGSVSVSCIATPGLVILNHRDTQTNQQINSIIPADRRQSHFIFWSCRRLAAAVMLGGSGGSVFHNMNKTSFENLLLVYPGEEIARTYSKSVSQIHDLILSNEYESDTLAQTRDLLLPKLMSGEIRLTEAEKAVEAVA